MERTLIPPLYYACRDPVEGEFSSSFLWPLSIYRSARRLDDSLATQLRPFVYQRTAGGRGWGEGVFRQHVVKTDDKAIRS